MPGNKHALASLNISQPLHSDLQCLDGMSNSQLQKQTMWPPCGKRCMHRPPMPPMPVQAARSSDMPGVCKSTVHVMLRAAPTA